MSDRSSLARHTILDAASAVFAEEGYAGARVDEIARRAGVNKAMLYYHVGNKQTLYSAVLNRNFDRVEAALSEAMAAGGSARVRLASIIAGVTSIMQELPDHPRILLREFASGGANLQPEVLQRMMRLLGMVRTVLADGVRSREFRTTDPVMTHLTLVGASLFLNAVSPLRERASEIDPEVGESGKDGNVGAFLADFLMHGIATHRTGETS